ncbi:hypothetical protein Tco_0820219 [Tanacetum coccineum]|uniref:Uncharacterized protein n=1 Tax=Tanacetum coccineum TaxID=301880 RepID=A0ABQ5A8T7_9ASTR
MKMTYTPVITSHFHNTLAVRSETYRAERYLRVHEDGRGASTIGDERSTCVERLCDISMGGRYVDEVQETEKSLWLVCCYVKLMIADMWNNTWGDWGWLHIELDGRERCHSEHSVGSLTSNVIQSLDTLSFTTMSDVEHSNMFGLGGSGYCKGLVVLGGLYSEDWECVSVKWLSGYHKGVDLILFRQFGVGESGWERESYVWLGVSLSIDECYLTLGGRRCGGGIYTGYSSRWGGWCVLGGVVHGGSGGVVFLNEIDKLSKEYYYADHMNAILGVYTNLVEVTNLQCDYLETLEKYEHLEKELSKSRTMSKSFKSFQKHAINLELDLQQCKEKIKNDKSFKENQSKEFLKEREQYFEIQDLKAQLQDK